MDISQIQKNPQVESFQLNVDLFMIIIYIFTFICSIYHHFNQPLRRFFYLMYYFAVFKSFYTYYRQIKNQVKSHRRNGLKMFLIILMNISLIFDIILAENDDVQFKIVKSSFHMILVTNCSFLFILEVSVLIHIAIYSIVLIFLIINIKQSFKFSSEILFTVLNIISLYLFKLEFKLKKAEYRQKEESDRQEIEYYKSIIDYFPGFFISILDQNIIKINSKLSNYLNYNLSYCHETLDNFNLLKENNINDSKKLFYSKFNAFVSCLCK